MPNQRDSRKKKIGVWLLPEELTAINALIKEEGYRDYAELFRALVVRKAQELSITRGQAPEATKSEDILLAEESPDYGGLANKIRKMAAALKRAGEENLKIAKELERSGAEDSKAATEREEHGGEQPA
jgi:hypothetical protein